MDALSDLGYFYFTKGRHKKSLAYLETRLQKTQQIQNTAEELKALSDLGIYYSKKNEYQKAILYFNKKLQIAQKINESQQEVSSLFSIGESYLKLNNYPKAIIYLRQAWEKNKGEKPEYGLKFGTALWKNNQIDEAKEILIKTLEAYDNQQVIPVFLEMLFSVIERDSFRFDGKFSSYDFDPIQQANQRKDKTIKGLVYTSNLLQKIILDQNKTEAALEFSEWSRVRSLTKLLTKRLQSLSRSQQAQVLEQYLEQIDEQVSEYYLQWMIWNIKQNKQLSPEQIEAFIQQIRQAVKEARQQNDDFFELSDPIKKLMYKSFTLAAYRPNIKPPNIQEIKQAAQERKATIVEYSVIDEANFDSSENQKKQKLLIWVIKPTGEVKFKQVNLQSLPLSLKDLVTNSRTSIGVRSRSSFERVPESGYSSSKQLQQLHELLITPIKDFLPSDPNARVIFIPQDSLFFVPFPALKDKKGKYLIEKHTILTSPSIEILQLTKKQRQKPKGSEALVVGNPTMSSTPIPIGEQSNGEQAKLKPLPNLPGAEQEAITIAQLLNTKALTGKQATKDVIKEKLVNARFIHLATHGLLDNFDGFGVPGALVLAASEKDNGLLTSNEISDWELNAELVVLSACDTGQGNITGDGVIGLSRSFIEAGVPSLVVSLWSVPDAPTANLMTEFYRNFNSGQMDKAQALRKAMLTVMKQYPDNPANWAAFTLIGEAE